jgi:hypothetical protein
MGMGDSCISAFLLESVLPTWDQDFSFVRQVYTDIDLPGKINKRLLSFPPKLCSHYL